MKMFLKLKSKNRATSALVLSALLTQFSLSADSMPNYYMEAKCDGDATHVSLMKGNDNEPTCYKKKQYKNEKGEPVSPKDYQKQLENEKDSLVKQKEAVDKEMAGVNEYLKAPKEKLYVLEDDKKTEVEKKVEDGEKPATSDSAKEPATLDSAKEPATSEPTASDKVDVGAIKKLAKCIFYEKDGNGNFVQRTEDTDGSADDCVGKRDALKDDLTKHVGKLNEQSNKLKTQISEHDASIKLLKDSTYVGPNDNNFKNIIDRKLYATELGSNEECAGDSYHVTEGPNYRYVNYCLTKEKVADKSRAVMDVIKSSKGLAPYSLYNWSTGKVGYFASSAWNGLTMENVKKVPGGVWSMVRSLPSTARSYVSLKNLGWTALASTALGGLYWGYNKYYGSEEVAVEEDDSGVNQTALETASANTKKVQPLSSVVVRDDGQKNLQGAVAANKTVSKAASNSKPANRALSSAKPATLAAKAKVEAPKHDNAGLTDVSANKAPVQTVVVKDNDAHQTLSVEPAVVADNDRSVSENRNEVVVNSKNETVISQQSEDRIPLNAESIRYLYATVWGI